MEALYRKVYVSIKRCKINGCEDHNLRYRNEPHFFQDRLIYNENIISEPIEHALHRIRMTYLAVKGKEYPKVLHPLKEMVVVIDEKTTMEQMQEFCREAERKLGINALQIHIHRDEGHLNYITNKWTCNYHAHIVWNTANRDIHSCQFGKLVSLTAQLDFFYDLAVRVTGMQRGNQVKKEKYSIWQYKVSVQEKHFSEVLSALSLLEEQHHSLKCMIQHQRKQMALNQSKMQLFEAFFCQLKSGNVSEVIENILQKSGEGYSSSDIQYLVKPLGIVLDHLAVEACKIRKTSNMKAGLTETSAEHS